MIRSFPVPGDEGSHVAVVPFSSAVGQDGGGDDSSESVFVKGKMRVRVLSPDGVLECMGCCMDDGGDREQEQAFSVFSPRGYSLLGFRATKVKGKKKQGKVLKKRLRDLGFEGKDVQEVVDAAEGEVDGGAVAIFSRLSDHLDALPGFRGGVGRMSLFGRDDNLPNLPSSTYPDLEKAVGVNLFSGEADVGLRYFRSLPEWDAVLDSVAKDLDSKGKSRVMVIGGKGVGKSSFAKYLTNRLLTTPQGSSLRSLLFVDLDPGQAEFTLPGCVSASVINAPVLGPNFCHLSNPKVACAYVGDVNVSNCKERYDRALSYLSGVCSNPANQENVWIVNSMGFNRGLGLPLMAKAVQRLAPTTVVVIQSQHESKNYAPDFLEEVIPPDCRVHTFPAVPEEARSSMGSHDLWGMPEPRKLRDLVVMSYFSSIPSKTRVSVRWRDVFVQRLCRELPSSATAEGPPRQFGRAV